jgi:hypothetical protein
VLQLQPKMIGNFVMPSFVSIELGVHGSLLHFEILKSGHYLIEMLVHCVSVSLLG